jgi:outer membrane protein assembly factor BamB
MLLWKKDLSTTHSVSPLIEGDQIITADIHGIVRAFGLQGNEMWKFDAHGSIAGRPAAAMGLLAIATTKGDIYTLDIISGRVRSNIGVDEIFTGQLSLFATQYRDEPTIAILLGTASGKMLCYDLFYLDEIWRNENATEMIETKPLVVNDRIIYGSRDGYLYCIDATTGQLNWRWSDSKNFYFSPAACYPVTDSSAVYIAAPDNYVTKIDLLLGKPEWRKKDFNAWESIGISPDKQKIYVKSLQNKFYIVKTDSGGLLYADSLGFGVDTVPIEINSVNDTIIIGSKNGSIYLILNSAFRKLFFIGTSRILSTVHWKNTIYTALNMDGTLVVFDIAKRK